MSKKQLFAMLPSVDEMLNQKEVILALDLYPRVLIVEGIRESINIYRKKIVELKDNEEISIKIDEIITNALNIIKQRYNLSLKKVINGTGIVIHTNLGRSLLSESIKDEVWSVASGYSNLEYNIDEGKRGSRYDHLTDMIKRLTDAEDVLVVNNNAAAVLLVLSTMAKEKEVIVSRGELVEVGGSFRIPSIMELSGAKLVEVGATNKTHSKDYENAITEETSILMKVHTSNYKILGFTKEVEVNELKILGEKYNLPVVEDLGSGVFVDLSKYGLAYERSVIDALKDGADIVTFSGDKMLGGPQAGIIVGKKKYIDMMKKNQLTRALRVDKITISALEATLRLYLDEEKAIKNIPTLRMLTYTEEEIIQKSNILYNKINNENLEIHTKIQDGLSQVGGGSMPLETMPTKLISIVPKNMSVANLEKKLRLSESHIIGRVNDDMYLLDVRTIFDNEFDEIVKELKKALTK